MKEAVQMAVTEAVRVGRHRSTVPRPTADRAVAVLTARLIRRSVLAVGIGLAAYLVIEAVVFAKTYPDEASRAALTVWGKDPGIRIIAGPATAVDTVGGFVVWDAGLYLTLILGAWALTTTTRVLRGDEDAGRADLQLSGPIRPARMLLDQLAVLLLACAALGALVAASLAVAGAQPLGSALYGAATWGYSAAVVGVAGLASQVLATRRAALAAAGSVLTVWILLRMVSNSSESREWLGWLTPLGWTDQVRPFGENRAAVLLVPLAVTLAFVGAMIALRGQRDTGAGLVAVRDERRSWSWGLGSAMAFGVRANLGVLVGWAVGVVAAGAVVGLLLPTMAEFLESDESYQDILTAMGLDLSDLTRGFIGMWSVILGLIIAVYAAFRMGAARAEEASSRAELLLTRPLPRWRWLGGHVLGVVFSVLVLTSVGAAAIWLSALAADAPLAGSDAFAAMFNTVPAILVFVGIGVLVFGVAPRLTVPVAAAAAVIAYVVDIVGPLLEWPAWVVALSPFNHLEAVPVDTFGMRAAVVMVLVGGALVAAGLVAFERRDLVGA